MSPGTKEGAQFLPGKAGIKIQLFMARFRQGFVASGAGCSQIFFPYAGKNNEFLVWVPHTQLGIKTSPFTGELLPNNPKPSFCSGNRLGIVEGSFRKINQALIPARVGFGI